MDKKGDGFVLWVGAACVCLALYYYNKDEQVTKAVPVPSYAQVSYAADAAAEVAAPTASPPPIKTPPLHRYDATEDKVYFYLGSPSEDERKRGIASGPTLAFRYYGRNEGGEHVLRSYTANGYPIKFYYCSDPCNLMKDDSGERSVINNDTIMGAVVDDIRNGFLQKSKRPPQQTAKPATEPELEVEPSTDTELPQPVEN